LYVSPENPDVHILHVINHHPDGSTIELMERTQDSNVLHHYETVSLKDVPCPNDVVPVGRFAFIKVLILFKVFKFGFRSSFYTTNDHYFCRDTSGWNNRLSKFGAWLARELEEVLALPLGNVVYRDDNKKEWYYIA
jgi:hypothetical protein